MRGWWSRQSLVPARAGRGGCGRGGSWGVSKAFGAWQQVVAPWVSAIAMAALALNFSVFIVVVGAFIAAVAAVLAWIAHGSILIGHLPSTNAGGSMCVNKWSFGHPGMRRRQSMHSGSQPISM